MADLDPHYVVLLGLVGCGKSTIVEKVTGITGRASDNLESATRRSEPLWSLREQFIISDTPGSNSCSDQFEQNGWIATAFNYRPLSKIFIVVRADAGRIDNVISGIREFSDRFVDLPFDPLGVLVTHMDKVTWPNAKSEFKKKIMDKCQIDDVVFSRIDTPSQTLIHGILSVCTARFDLTVNHENFLRIFQKLHKNTPRAVLQLCNSEVAEFKKKHTEFNSLRANFDKKRQVDLVFEFNAYMKQEITEAQKRVAFKFEFTFEGEAGRNEAAHLSNMTNQLISELHIIRIESLSYHGDHGVLRKCPHCHKVWTKVQGCDAATTCGSRPTSNNDLRESGYAEMATFTFSWNADTNKLTISESGSKKARKMAASAKGVGCGKQIIWEGMADVEVPAEFSSTVDAVRMSDVPMMPNDSPLAANFNDGVDNMLDRFKNQMILAPRPLSS